ncbi:hypothetical protein Q4575_10030 [Psychrosphaera sp. 1_MG-2023]|uniref:hypothetical protein n=1 Tax=Psychrosphaera sp. 1_MG-2023 TaxID=3062643 RepID=UPI0026E27F0E|nr:hypothetical protein [Psychrosphaera sp. 1_MG-2023]MDO6719741.1 hypothetical protein [Psychrosphaera sp. 1_MG-2023]
MKKNKIVLIGAFIVAFCVAIFVIFSHHLEQNVSPEAELKKTTQLTKPTSLQQVKLAQSQARAMAKVAQVRQAEQSQDVTLTVSDKANLEELATNKRIEIEQATLDYNDESLDEDERKLIKLQIQNLMNEYNQLILPLAISKMSQTSNSG